MNSDKVIRMVAHAEAAVREGLAHLKDDGTGLRTGFLAAAATYEQRAHELADPAWRAAKVAEIKEALRILTDPEAIAAEHAELVAAAAELRGKAPPDPALAGGASAPG